MPSKTLASIKIEKKLITNTAELFFTREYVYKRYISQQILGLRLDDKKVRANVTLKGYEFDSMVSPYVYEELVEEDSGGIVKMKRLPDETNFLNVLRRGDVDRDMMERISLAILKMHRLVEDSSCKCTLTKDDYWLIFNENVSRISNEVKYIEDKQLGIRISNIIDSCKKIVRNYESIVCHRYCESYIQLLHGDLHAGNLFVDEHNVYITDSVFPIEHWRYGDYGVDLSALSMDLEAYGYEEYSQLLVKEYADKRGDRTLNEVFLLYKLNWALIRFVVGLQAFRERGEDPKIYELYLDLIEKYLE